MSAETSLRALLNDLRKVLTENGIRWYLFGAHAVAAYAAPRTTADVDVTVDIPMEAVGSFSVILQRAGFLSRVEDLEPFVERTRVVPVVHSGSGVPVDLVVAGPGLEQTFLDAARPLELAGIEVPVIRVGHLIASKILAGRPKDLEDVRSMLQGQLEPAELEECRRILRLLEEALDRGDLLPELEKAGRGM